MKNKGTSKLAFWMNHDINHHLTDECTTITPPICDEIDDINKYKFKPDPFICTNTQGKDPKRLLAKAIIEFSIGKKYDPPHDHTEVI